MSTAVDPSTYTLGGVDSAAISTTSTSVTFTNIGGADDAYIYKDIGAGLIGDFTIQATLNVDSISGLGGFMYLGVSDTVGNAGDMDTANNGLVFFASAFIGQITSSLIEYEVPANSVDLAAAADDTNWYVTFSRSGATATLTIRDTSHTGTVLDSQTCTVGGASSWRYLYLGMTRETGGGTQTWTLSDITEDITAGNDYVITCDTQAYLLEAFDAAINTGFQADAGTYAIADYDADLIPARLIQPIRGFYTFNSPVNEIIPPPPTIPVDEGEYALGFNDARITKHVMMPVVKHTYVLSGKTINTSGSIKADQGSFAIAGIDAAIGGNQSLIPRYIYTLGP